MSNLLFQFTHYMSTALGIENVLRLLQAISQIFASWGTLDINDALKWRVAGKQFALGRRYFRYFQFITYFQNAWKTFTGQNEAVARRGRTALSIEVCFLSFYGCYLLLEACTIFDYLGVHSTEWSKMIFVEANKLWFYALVFSIMGNSWQLFCLYLAPKSPQSNGSTKPPKTELSSKPQPETKSDSTSDETEKKPQRQIHTNKYLPYPSLVRNLALNGCDLLIPGSFLGWIGASPLFVSSAMVVSTVLVGADRWEKAQKNV